MSRENGSFHSYSRRTPTGPLAIKFEVAPDNTVTGFYFGSPGDITLLTRKGRR